MQIVSNALYQPYTNSMVSLIQSVTESHIIYLARNNFNEQKIHAVFDCLKIMLNGNYEKYKFNEHVFNNNIINSLCETEVQKVLSKLNEKQSVRKSNGVYYTPKDVVSFIVDNCFDKRVNQSNRLISKLDNSIDNFDSIIYQDSIFDPTCGAGEFLLGALEKKIDLIKNKYCKINDENLLTIISTIYGNDINIESVEISKIRLFFEIIKHTDSLNSYYHFAEIINKNITCKDFVNVTKENFNKFDIIIGNPPYVEDRKSMVTPYIKYGNIYANILHNSIDLLNKNGIIGFIIPISYTSTPRMKKIRKYVEEHTKQQFIMNYADRPDCLFTSVHQKLSIIFAIQGIEKCELYTSGYKYWYKNERNSLFSNIDIVLNKDTNDNFYPKIGNKLELSIFKKIYTCDKSNIFEHGKCQKHNIYINMRACFWIKAFTFNPGSKEYKGFGFDNDLKYFILCILNSSLFFFFWNAISDCWHITSKELKHFYIHTNSLDIERFKKLAISLENKLDETKKYIGTKQTEYEYKHKLCKSIIDNIDDALSDVYSLTCEELSYIKSYSSKYRESLGG